MRTNKLKSTLALAACLVSLCAFVYINRVSGHNAANVGNVAANPDSAAQKDEEEAFMPDADLLQRVIEKGKETFPVLIHLF